jgi:hypothetical protein
VTRVRTQVDDLSEAVARQADHDESTRPRIWWWPDLTEEQAGQSWQVLCEWVYSVLLGRHERFRIGFRPCWFCHTEVVDELTALCQAWLAAYIEGHSMYGPSEWLDRCLPNEMGRIDKDLSRCKTHDHLEPPPVPPVTADFSDFVTNDLTSRESAEQPALKLACSQSARW